MSRDLSSSVIASISVVTVVTGIMVRTVFSLAVVVVIDIVVFVGGLVVT